MLYNERNRRTNRDAARRNEAAIRGQRTPAPAPRAPRVIKSDDPSHINNRTRPEAPAQDSAPSVTATRSAFARTLADLGARRAEESTATLRALRA